MKYYFFLISLIFSIASLKAKELLPLDFYLYFTRPEVSSKIFPENALSYKELKSWDIQSYENFLEKLNSKKPQFYENEVIIHSSSSLQASTLENPRVLLFGEGVVMSFNEDKSVEERRLEMVEFDRDKVRFVPREIIFSKDEVTFNDNPTSCRACHGEPFRPIWNPYDFWPRAFGSRIGRIGSDKELKAYNDYFANRTHGIRRFLKKDAVPEGDHFMLRSVEAFTGYMNTLNSMTMGKELASIDLKGLELPLRWILNNCANGADSDEKFKTLFPTEVWEGMKLSYEDIKKDTFAARSWFKENSDDIYNSVFPNISTEYFFLDHNRLIDEADSVSKIRFILENRGISLRSMILSHGANDYFFSTPNNFIADLNDTYNHYLEVNLVDRPSVNDGNFTNIPISNSRCESLAQASRNVIGLDAISEDVQQLRYNRPAQDLSPIGRCMKCHALKYRNGKTRGPYIPFDNSAQMKELFKTTALADEMKYRITTKNPLDQMPPRHPLTKEERNSVLEYIEVLRK